jgi:hypothetical protein
MDHHGEGYKEAHPNYIEEKLYILNLSCADAFGLLDYINQAKLRAHLERWEYEMPL